MKQLKYLFKVSLPKKAKNPYLVILVLSAVIVIFVRNNISRYVIKVDKSFSSNRYYEDVDGNGSFESFEFRSNHHDNNIITFTAFNEDGSLINQWNIKGHQIATTYEHLYFKDLNRNGYEEAYFFIRRTDSLFLVSIDNNRTNNHYEARFITKIERSPEGNYSYALKIKSADIDGDSRDELVFLINGYFSVSPRKVGILDYDTGQLKLSKETGNSIKYLTFTDINRDGSVEITGSTRSPGNVRNENQVLFSDSSCWLFLLDKNLEYKFPPVEFPIIYSTLVVTPVQEKDSTFLVSFLSSISENTPECNVYRFDVNGRLRNKRYDRLLEPPVVIFPMNRDFMIVKPGHEIFKYDYRTGDIMKTFRVKAGIDRITFGYENDLNDDGVNELVLFNGNTGTVAVVNDVYNDLTEINFLQLRGREFFLSFSGNNQFFIQNGHIGYLLSYHLNHLYFFVFLLIIPVFGIGLLLWRTAAWTSNRIIEKKVANRAFLAELKIKTLRNQLEPHFLFNTMNSIGYLIMTEKPKRAYNYLQHLSTLLRDILQQSDEINIRLHEELRLIRNYLDLEKIRFEERFDYHISISENVDLNMKVPRLLIQLHVENALKHGIMHLKEKGMIRISIKHENADHIITIEDNGIGRKAAAGKSEFYSGAGMGISKKLISLHHELTKGVITQEIKDLDDQYGNPAGTRVIIKFHYNV